MITIKDAAAQFGISTHAIRFFEKEGLIDIPRDSNGNRIFDDKTLSRLKAINYYRHLGLPHKQIKELISDFHNHEKSLVILSENLADLEFKIKELQATKAYIAEKIELHQLLQSLQDKGATEAEQYQAYEMFVAQRAEKKFHD